MVGPGRMNTHFCCICRCESMTKQCEENTSGMTVMHVRLCQQMLVTVPHWTLYQSWHLQAYQDLNSMFVHFVWSNQDRIKVHFNPTSLTRSGKVRIVLFCRSRVCQYILYPLSQRGFTIDYHPSLTHNPHPLRVAGGAAANPGWDRSRGMVHPGQVVHRTSGLCCSITASLQSLVEVSLGKTPNQNRLGWPSSVLMWKKNVWEIVILCESVCESWTVNVLQVVIKTRKVLYKYSSYDGRQSITTACKQIPEKMFSWGGKSEPFSDTHILLNCLLQLLVYWLCLLVPVSSFHPNSAQI